MGGKIFKIIKSELIHFQRSPYKIISIILYVLAIIYGCQNGYDLYRKHNLEISNIKAKIKDVNDKMIIQYEDIEENKIKKPRRDPTTPYWAVRNTSTYAFKYPSKMMVFSIGQAEQYGYYKYITNWSTVFDEDLAMEIANPERLAMGTIDFNFVFLYLTPILLIIMLFNVGGLERDLAFDRLIVINNISKNQWLFLRFIFYYVIIFTVLLAIVIFYGFWLDIIISEFPQLFNLIFLIVIYLLLWCCLFYFININGKGSFDQSIKMISIWLAFCIIIPGAIHQISSVKYPTNYMIDYLNVNREKSNEIFNLPIDTLNVKILRNFKFLETTKNGVDLNINKNIINKSVSSLINILNKNVANFIETKNEYKNQFISSFNKINPVTFYQNEINCLAQTDYYAYRNYRNTIQSKIDEQINLILLETWNEEIVGKDKYLLYISNLK